VDIYIILLSRFALVARLARRLNRIEDVPTIVTEENIAIGSVSLQPNTTLESIEAIALVIQVRILFSFIMHVKNSYYMARYTTVGGRGTEPRAVEAFVAMKTVRTGARGRVARRKYCESFCVYKSYSNEKAEVRLNFGLRLSHQATALHLELWHSLY